MPTSKGVEGVHTEIYEVAKRHDTISIALKEAVNTMKVELLKTENLTLAVDNLSKLVEEFI